MEEDKHGTSQKVFSEVQMKAITAGIRDLLKEAPKGHVGVPQLGSVVGPPYLKNR